MRNIERVRRPSLETRWLHRSDKWLPQPEVYFVDELPGSGCYLSPGNTALEEGTGVIGGAGGAIVIAGLYWGKAADEPEKRAVIAHEWRHHWQHFRGWKYDGIPLDLSAGYDGMVRRYFRCSRSEADALAFEARTAPSYLTDLTLGIVYGTATS